MSNTQDDNQTVVWAILVAVIVLAIGLAVGFSKAALNFGQFSV
jgi:hypothetical protein